MSTTSFTGRQWALALTIVAAAIALIVTVGLILREYAPGNMGNGFLIGAGAATVAVIIMGWRVWRNPAKATPFERAYTQSGDERDNEILTRSLATLGLLSVPSVAIAAVLIGVGLPQAPVLGITLYALIAVFVAAFIVISRRH